jgi:L-2-amino-thiazoline-4-carboxylic acid hydrolase
VPARQRGLDLVLPGHQPVHRCRDLIGAGPGHPQIKTQGEVSVPGGYGLDVTRCPMADYFRDLGLGPLCEQTICVQDERVAREYGGPAGIRFTRQGTIAGGAERCDFRYRPAATPIVVGTAPEGM